MPQKKCSVQNQVNTRDMFQFQFRSRMSRKSFPSWTFIFSMMTSETIQSLETILTDGLSQEEIEIPCYNLSCSKVFKKKCNLNRHMKICRFNAHPNKKYECFKCKMQLARSDGLKRHLRRCGIPKTQDSSSTNLVGFAKSNKDIKLEDFLKLLILLSQ